MTHARAITAAIAALCAIQGTARGDQWPPPQLQHWSSNGRYVLKVSWGWGKPDRLSLWDETENGPVELWSRGYVEEDWPPHTAHVADDGQHVVLRDTYHHLGRGKCLTFLGLRGEEIRSYELEDFLTRDEICRFTISISSVWWSHPGWFRLRAGDRQFALITAGGSIRCFDVATGARLELDERLRSEILAEAVPELREQLDEGDPRQRAGAATLLGFVATRDCVPQLLNAMRQGGITHSVMRSGSAPWYAVLFGRVTDEPVDGVSVASAEALVRLLGADALPLIEPQVAASVGVTREELLNAMANEDFWEPGRPALSRNPVARAVWQRLAESDDPDVRGAALRQLLRSDDGAFLRGHLELLDSTGPWIGETAVIVLCETATASDHHLLRRVVENPKRAHRCRALDVLVRLNPEDLPSLLEGLLKDKDGGVRLAATLELARRGHEPSIGALLKRVASWRAHTHTRGGWAAVESDAREVCRTLFEARLTRASPVLREVAEVDCEAIRVQVAGVLAGFGDSAALSRLRGSAATAQVSERTEALSWLGRINDVGAESILRAALGDEERTVRTAAQDALDTLAGSATSRPAPDRESPSPAH